MKEQAKIIVLMFFAIMAGLFIAVTFFLLLDAWMQFLRGYFGI